MTELPWERVKKPFAEASELPTQLPAGFLEELGQGGMGVVYMAEQTEPVRRRMALKIVKLGMDTREVVGRFEAERQALAVYEGRLDAEVGLGHPLSTRWQEGAQWGAEGADGAVISADGRVVLVSEKTLGSHP